MSRLIKVFNIKRETQGRLWFDQSKQICLPGKRRFYAVQCMVKLQVLCCIMFILLVFALKMSNYRFYAV